MRKTFKKYFIPHEHNEYKPHILRERSVLVIGFVIVLVFILSAFQGVILQKLDLAAAIITSALTDLANDDRLAYAVSPLKVNPSLVEAAKLKANDMAAKSYFAHTSPEGIEPWHWFRQAGYNFLYAGENLAVDFFDSEDVNEAWLNSPSHRANILNPNFTEIGIATARGFWQGRETTFVVQLFGRPSSVFDFGVRELETVPETIPGEETEETNVAGEEIVTVEPEPEIIIENETFIAVRAAEIPPEEELSPQELLPVISEPQPDQGQELGAASYASWLEEILASPKRTLTIVYVILASIILLALILAVLIEIHKQHPRHITYAILLLVFIGIFFWLNRTLIIPEVLVR